MSEPSTAFDPDVFRARFAHMRRLDQLTRHSSSPHPPGLRPPSPATGRPPSKNSTASTSPKTTTAARFAALISTPPATSELVDTVIA